MSIYNEENYYLNLDDIKDYLIELIKNDVIYINDKYKLEILEHLKELDNISISRLKNRVYIYQ